PGRHHTGEDARRAPGGQPSPATLSARTAAPEARLRRARAQPSSVVCRSMRLLALTLVGLAVGASGSPRDELAEGCTPSFAARLETGSATQLITVVARARASTQGSLRLWTKR